MKSRETFNRPTSHFNNVIINKAISLESQKKLSAKLLLMTQITDCQCHAC